MTGPLKMVVQLFYDTWVIWWTLKLSLNKEDFLGGKEGQNEWAKRGTKCRYGEEILFSKHTSNTTSWWWPTEWNTWNFPALISEGKAGEKAPWFASISAIFLHTGGWFPCLLRHPVTSDVPITEPTLLLLLEVSGVTQTLLWPQERVPHKLFFLILLGRFHVGQREDPFPCTVL